MFGPRVKGKEADEQIIAILDAAPGWRLADMKELEDKKVRLTVEVIRKVGIPASSVEASLGSNPFGSPPSLRPLHEDGTPASDLAFVYPPSDKRPDEELLNEFCEELRKKNIVKESK